MHPVDGYYRTPGGLTVKAEAVSWTATRSGGPGGQHANTSDTAVTVTIDVGAAGLPDAVAERVVSRAGATVAASSAESRSQLRNRSAAWTAAMARLDAAARPPRPPRRRTRPSAGAVEERLTEKRRTGERKRRRQAPTLEE